jgi:cytochrome c oxidase cbb3-type subunit 2
MLNPRAVVPSSIMPAYPWLERRSADADGDIQQRMRALKRLGHPYMDAEIEAAAKELDGKTELDALVAYLQALGRSATRGGQQ